MIYDKLNVAVRRWFANKIPRIEIQRRLSILGFVVTIKEIEDIEQNA